MEIAQRSEQEKLTLIIIYVLRIFTVFGRGEDSKRNNKKLKPLRTS